MKSTGICNSLPFIAIDLKSFYASAECADRGPDFTTPRLHRSAARSIASV